MCFLTGGTATNSTSKDARTDIRIKNIFILISFHVLPHKKLDYSVNPTCICYATEKQKQKEPDVLVPVSSINTSMCYDLSLVPMDSDYEDEDEEENSMYDDNLN